MTKGKIAHNNTAHNDDGKKLFKTNSHIHIEPYSTAANCWFYIYKLFIKKN